MTTIYNTHGGARSGAGRKRQPYAETIGALIRSAATPEDLENVVKALIARAIAGDIRAAEMILNHFYGKPTERIETTHIEPQRIIVEFEEITPKHTLLIEETPNNG